MNGEFLNANAGVDKVRKLFLCCRLLWGRFLQKKLSELEPFSRYIDTGPAFQLEMRTQIVGKI